MKIFLSVLSIALLAIIIVIAIPFVEALRMKPFKGNYDCRIVNTAEAIKEGKELRLYVKEGVELTHIIALNEDGTIIDKSFSENGKNDNGKKIEELESIKGVKLAYKKTVDGKETIYINDIETYIQVKYINLFTFFYKKINY